MPLLILVAEDDPGIRLAVCDYLEFSGYSTIAAENGVEAIALLESYRPHLIVADIKMPLKDGYHLVKQVRNRPEFRLLPVIFLTEFGSTEDRILGYKAGCDLYLPKPFEMEELGAVIRNLLERSQIVQSEIVQSEKRGYFEENKPPPKTARLLFADTEAIDLTHREEQVLQLLATGLSNVDIGTELHLSPRTVEKHVSSLLRKTETNNRAELVRFALERHLVD